MSADSDNDPFYIGYLPKAPAPLARFTRRAIVAVTLGSLALAGLLAVTLPYFGTGTFEYGNPRDVTGVVRCDAAPRLTTAGTDYLLVGAGKNGVALEICGASGSEATLRGTLIERDGRKALEIASTARPSIVGQGAAEPIAQSLGRFTLTGEIVDSKCYFGVMNPAEGRLHRACAVQCLRGGVPAVFVARDRAGDTIHLLVTGPAGQPINDALLRWAGEGVEARGEVLRQGQWLVWRLEPDSLRLAQR